MSVQINFNSFKTLSCEELLIQAVKANKALTTGQQVTILKNRLLPITTQIKTQIQLLRGNKELQANLLNQIEKLQEQGKTHQAHELLNIFNASYKNNSVLLMELQLKDLLVKRNHFNKAIVLLKLRYKLAQGKLSISQRIRKVKRDARLLNEKFKISHLNNLTSNLEKLSIKLTKLNTYKKHFNNLVNK